MPIEPMVRSARRHRSAVACDVCRRRKVRCSLSVTGVPCSGCVQDHTDCIVSPRRAIEGRRSHTPAVRHSHQNPSQAQNSSDAQNSMNTSNLPQQTLPPSRSPIVNYECDNVENEERNGIEIAEAALGQPHRAGEVPFYTGEQTGPTSALSYCSPGQALPRHVLIPSSIRASLSEEDREFLRVKGVFTLPRNDTCTGLLQAYFCHVHPIMPIIEADGVLKYHHDGRLHEYNLLLLWSSFFVAVNFVPARVYEKEGYKSRREMKAVMYSRAKCMYNNGGESEKIVLLQSSLLLGFWHSEIDGHMQPWYWTGIAISLCQMLGLHRNPDAAKYNPCFINRQRSLWRRLWWSCVFRDRWLGLTFGRPLRINLNDCDAPKPVASDLLQDLEVVPESISAPFVPSKMLQLAKYWITLVELSELLGSCLTMNYQTVRSRPSVNEVEALEAQILQCKLPDQYEAGLTRLAKFHCYHVHLHYQALLITFNRPLAAESAAGLPSTAEEEDWCHRMQLKADSAASQTNNILEALAQERLLEFAGPMTPPLLVPAMQTHLLYIRSADSLSRSFRFNKLDMLMLVMEEFQKTYTVASLYRGIFMKAIQQVFPNYRASTALSVDPNTVPARDISNSTGSGVNEQTEPASGDMFGYNAQQLGTMINDDFVDALMEQPSFFNIWENWDQLWTNVPLLHLLSDELPGHD